MYVIETEETVPFKNDPFKAHVRRERFRAVSWCDEGELRYFRLDPYNVKPIAKSDIKSIKQERK